VRLGVFEAFQQALIHLKAERFDEAAGALYLAASTWPKSAELWYLAGCLEERAGKPGAAADCYRKALALDAGHRGARENLAQMALGLFRLGLAREAEGAIDQAAAAYGEALHLVPDHAEAAERLKRLARARIGEAALEPLGEGYLGSLRAELLDGEARAIAPLAQAGQPAQAGLCALRTLAIGWPSEADWRNAQMVVARLFAGTIEHHLGQNQLDQARVLLAQVMPWVGEEPALVRLRTVVVQRYRLQAEARRRAGDRAGASAALRALLALTPEAGEAKTALESLLAEGLAAAGEAAARAKAAEARGDIEAAVAAHAAAAEVAPDPDPHLAAMTAARYRAYSAPHSTLVWPGIGRVEVENRGPLLVVTAAERPRQGWALVSFLREHVVFDDAYEHFWTTSIHWESREICRILLELGYDLHVINTQAPAPERPERHDVVFTGPPELLRLAPAIPREAVKIGLLTGSSPDFQDAAEAARIAALQARRPGPYAAKRTVGKDGMFAGIEAADRLLLIGNAQTLSTFPERYRGKIEPIRVSASPLAFIKPAAELVPKEREFLWYFGHGAVLKGLDLLLEIFSRQETWTLNVVGLVLDEPDFLALYGNELLRHKQILFHGHLRGNSPELARIHRRSLAFVAPSASEGMSNACATCMTAGLYPILSRTTGIDLPDGLGLYLERCSIPEIEAAIGRVHAMEADALARDIGKIQAYAQDAFGRAAYAREMRRLLGSIVAAGR
jgi:tetratricopeptide (TPR) repeat protein